MNNGVQTSVWAPAFNSFRRTPRNQIVGICRKSMFNFLRNDHALSTAAAPFDDTFLPATHMGARFSQPCQRLRFILLLLPLMTGWIWSGVSLRLWLAFTLPAAPPAAWGLSSASKDGTRGVTARGRGPRHWTPPTPDSSPFPFNVTPLSTHLWPRRVFLAAPASSLALVFGLLVSAASLAEKLSSRAGAQALASQAAASGSVAAVHSPSCPWACGVPPSLLLWRLGPLSLSHGKPTPPLKKKVKQVCPYWLALICPTQHVEA